jgi:hypothetical protein
MNAFPIIAAFTACVSIAILVASFDDLREAPLNLEAVARPEAARQLIPVAARRGESAPMPGSIWHANEGLLDRELASSDPIGAWLDRYLTPPSDTVPPTD